MTTSNAPRKPAVSQPETPFESYLRARFGRANVATMTREHRAKCYAQFEILQRMYERAARKD
jgi:hypothetical protein